MNTNLHIRSVALAILCTYLFISCGLVRNASRAAGEGFIESIHADSGKIALTLLGSAGRGLRDSVLTDETSAAVTAMVDEIMRVLTERGIVLRDTLLNEELNASLREIVRVTLGESTKQYVADIRDEFFGETTALYIAGWRDALLNEETVIRAARLRDELLGPNTAALVSSIADSVLAVTILQWEEQLRPGVREEISVIQRYASQLLILTAVLAVGVIGFSWRQRQKYRRLLNMITFQIHEISDQDLYDELTGRIKRKAQEEGVEPDLRKILDEQGIIGTGSWKPERKK
jgi:hypothetical protein